IPKLRGAFFWSYTGVTPTGGPLTAIAKVILGDDETLSSTHSIQLAVSNLPPDLNVDQPTNEELFTGTEDGTVIHVSGRATSIVGFGPNAIAWNLDNGQASGTPWVVNGHWSTDIHVPADLHTITFTCTDLEGISTSVTRQV